LLGLWQRFAAACTYDLHPLILIGDSSGTLKPAQFSGGTVVRHHFNRTHGEKIDFFLHNYVTSDYVLLCDDDILLVDPEGIEWAIARLESNPQVAAVSLKPRRRFKWSIGGQEYVPMGTYCLLFRRKTFVNERLSFRTVHAPSPSPLSYNGEFDTADFANVELIKRGYEVAILPDDLQQRSYIEMHGMSFPIVTLRRMRGQIGAEHHEALFRSLYSHHLLRSLYTQLDLNTKWSILPGGGEAGVMNQIAEYLPIPRRNELKVQVEQTIDLIRQKAEDL
jgi:hypothetical protein